MILGPTAGGKTDLAIALALRLTDCDGQPGQIISADSMQIYRQMDAGTAKPSPAQREQVPHHLIDCIDPTDSFTVSDWLTQADQLIEQLQQSGTRPIIVGGTNLYLNALLEGMFEGPPADPAFRESLAGISTHELHQQLSKQDADSAERIHPNDRKRLTRALEVLHQTGQPISQQQQQWSAAPTARQEGEAEDTRYRHDPILIGLDWPREAINQRINLRVKWMFHPDKARVQDNYQSWEPEPLPAEVTRLMQEEKLGPQSREALGYKQVLTALAGDMTMDEAYERTKILTRRFAKQQRTWMKRFRGVHWLPGPMPIIEKLDTITAQNGRIAG